MKIYKNLSGKFIIIRNLRKINFQDRPTEGVSTPLLLIMSLRRERIAYVNRILIGPFNPER